MSASGMGPFERAKQWAQANLENVEGAKLHKHDMCGWNSKGLANLTVKEEYGGWKWRTLTTAVKQLWPSVVKKPGANRRTDYLTDVRLKSSRYRYPYCLLFVLLGLKSGCFLFCVLSASSSSSSSSQEQAPSSSGISSSSSSSREQARAVEVQEDADLHENFVSRSWVLAWCCRTFFVFCVYL